MVITDLKSNNKKYSIIYADPPWEQKKGGKKAARPNSSGKDLDYPTMSLNDIKNILQQVKTEEKHNFFIWTIEKYLFQTEEKAGIHGETRSINGKSKCRFFINFQLKSGRS